MRLKIPKLRQQTFESAIIERYRRRESSVEEALIEMYAAVINASKVFAIQPSPSANARSLSQNNRSL